MDSNAIEFCHKGINFVGRTSENNGIQGKIQTRSFSPNEAFTITATVIGNYKYVKYQKEPYYCSQNINKLTPKPIIKKWNEQVAYYFIANIQCFVSLYDGQQAGYKLDDIKDHKIKIPIKNNEIDFEFIESFIAELEAKHLEELEAKHLEELEAYLTAAELKDYTLTKEEQKALENFDNVNFDMHKAISVFEIKNTKSILARDIVSNSGTTPYLCAGAENNAVNSYISYKEELLDKGKCIFIGGKTFVVSYQEHDFYSNDSHNLCLYLKEKAYNSKLNSLYLATCINKSLKHQYSWGDSISKNKIQKDFISLPTKNNQPDYDSMGLLISAVQKLVIKDVVLYSQTKIDATKNILKHNN